MQLQRHHHYGIGFLIGLLIFGGFVKYQAPKATALTDVVVLIDTSSDFDSTGDEFFCLQFAAPGTCSLRSAITSILVEDTSILFDTLGDVAWADNYHFIFKFSSSLNFVSLAGGDGGNLPELNFPNCTNCTLEIDGLADRSSPINFEGAAESNGFIVSDPTHFVGINNIKFKNFLDSAVVIKNSTIPHEVNNNIFGPQGSADEFTVANKTAITVSNSAHAKIQSNVIGGETGDAIILTGSNTFDTTVSGNYIGVEPGNIGTPTGPSAMNGILIESGAHDNVISGNANKNVIAHAGQNGISITSGNNNKIEEGNVWFDNAQKAIALSGGGNLSITQPNLISAVDSGTDIKIKGTGVAGAQINFYQATNGFNPTVVPDSSGGEGFLFVQDNVIDGGGDLDSDPNQFEFVISGVSIGDTLTAFQTNTSDNSSEFSNNIAVAATGPNQAPITNPTANPSNPASGSIVTLNANASDPDGDSLTFSWSQTSGPSGGSFSSTTGSSVSFTLPSVSVSTTFTFAVTVSDGTTTTVGTVSVTAQPGPNPSPTPTPTANPVAPVANAGPNQTVSQGSNVLLNGSGSSDANGDPLAYQWTQSGSDPYLVLLTNQNTVTPNFTAPNISELSVDLHFTLQVTDPTSLSSTDSVVITINRTQQEPVAKLKVFPTTSVLPGTQVILNGAESTFDPTATVNRYRFRQVTTSGSDIPLVIDQTSTSSPEARVLMPSGITTPTEFTFELVVNDGNQDSNPDVKVVTVSPQAPSTPSVCSDRNPIANAGDSINESKLPGEIITLNGTRSSDPDNNQPLTYFWRQQAGGVRVDIRNNQSAQPNFTVPALSTPTITMEFLLTVTDSCGLTDTDSMSVTLQNTDPDNDGLNNTRETELHTNPENPDTDGDLVNDGTEARSGILNPLNPDTDNDGLRDGEEDANRNGLSEVGETNGGNADTDGDSMPDGFEVRNQLNPNNPADAAEDSDRDGLPNREEFVFKTNPRNADTDGDGINDSNEAKGANKTSPNDSDSDDDGITDGNEDINHDGITQTNETHPTRFDTDGDGLSDGQEIGLTQPQSKGADLKKFKPDTDPLSKTGPLLADTDADRIPDGTEDANKNGSFDCGETNPMDPANVVKMCTPTPTPTKTSRSQPTTPSGSINVSRGNPVPTQQPTVSIVPGASIVVKGINKDTRTSQTFIANPQASIVVLPGILTAVGPVPLIPSIIVTAANTLSHMIK